MVKKDDVPKKSNDSFLGREADAELVHKVDGYMKSDQPETTESRDDKSTSKLKIEVTEPETEPNTSPKTEKTDQEASAPLLPTKELPPEVKDKPEGEKIHVVDQPESEVKEAEIPIKTATTQPENHTSPENELGLEDVGMNKAVDEIIAAESDEVLAAEDQKHKQAAPVLPATISQKIKHFFKAWWSSKRYRNATIGLAALLVLVAGVVPNSRYYVLNTLGVKASTSLTILDDKTGQPLKNVELAMSGKAGKTDSDGYVKLEKIKLGSQDMAIKKPAFAEVNRKVTIGWGSNPQGDIRLTPVGSRFSFLVTDFLSDKPVVKAEASSGVANARANEKGEIVLTVPESDKEVIDVQISAEFYRTDTIKVSTSRKEASKLQLVPGRKHPFISKRTGKFDLYKIDVDGKNEEKVLPGSGSEREDTLAVASHPTKNIAALVSTREGVRNRDGFLLSTLTLINLENNETTKAGRSERVQIVDFIGDKLVFVKIAEGTSAADPYRHRLMSYDIESGSEKELASTNYFNDVLIAKGMVYYSPAVYKVNGSVGLFEVKPDGTSKRTVFNKEVWNLFRTSHDKISASVGQDWYELNLSNGEFSQSSGAPPALKSRVYVDSPDQKSSLWVDERDGKGVLIKYDQKSREEKTALSQSGLRNPIRWLSNQHVVYRISSDQETADYVLNLSGGSPKKIRDVTNTAGVDRWYYY